jgi:Ca2+-binding RTX toxin-like protein
MSITNGTAGNDNLTGGASDDAINGLAGDDTLAGAAGYDTLAGGTGDDLLTGGGGNDLIQGDDDSETAVFTGNFADYSFAYDLRLGAYIVTDGVAARDGVDTVVAVESFAFADVTKALELLPLTVTGTTDLGANATHQAVVDLLYTNVTGAAPTAAQEAPFVALLDSGQYSPATLAICAAAAEPRGREHRVLEQGRLAVRVAQLNL